MTVNVLSPLPESLRRLPVQFSFVDRYGIAPDLEEGVRRLINSAWHGSVLDGVIPSATLQGNERIPLILAVSRSTAELDAAANEYLLSVPSEISIIDGNDTTFNRSLFSRDVVRAFTSLKNLTFDEMTTTDYDNIQGALSKHEDVWRSGPRMMEVFVIQQFCLRIVEFSNSLRQRTGCNFEEAMLTRAATVVAAPQSQERVMDYQNERIVGGPSWPSCVNVVTDWAALFGPDNELNKDCFDSTDEDEAPWLTPRMAAKIHHIAITHAELMLEDVTHLTPPLPKIARMFFKKSKAWRLAFRDCYVRIALRLQKGLPPQPNCTGEEMAFHNIMRGVPDAHEFLDDYDALPEYPKDDDCSLVTDFAIEDQDVLMLFEPGDKGYEYPEDEKEPDVDNNVTEPGSTASFMLERGDEVRAANMHPKDWFLAFKNDRFSNHVH